MDTIIDRAVAALESLKITTRDPSLSFADMRRAVRVAEVRAVLESIREPDGFMLVAYCGIPDNSSSPGAMVDTARARFHAMIDKALGK